MIFFKKKLKNGKESLRFCKKKTPFRKALLSCFVVKQLKSLKRLFEVWKKNFAFLQVSDVDEDL